MGLSCVSQCASHCSGYHNTAVRNGVVSNKEKPLHLSSTVLIHLCFSPWWFFLLFCFFNWVNLMLVKTRDQYPWLEQGTSWTFHLQLCQCTSILFVFFFLLFIYIFFNLVLMKGAGLTTLEAEALYLSTEQIHHGRQLCKLPHAAPTNVPHLCPGGTTSRGERIVQSPWPIQSLAFLLRLPTKLQ